MSRGRFLAKKILHKDATLNRFWRLGDDRWDLPGMETCFGCGFAYSVLDANAQIGTEDVAAAMV